jgi:hypothetical protein
MKGDYHEERTLILNENDSRTIFSTWFMVMGLEVMVFSTIFKHMSGISWQLVLLVNL